MNIHPAAMLFPMFGKDDLRKLADDIRERGLLHAIVVTREGGHRSILDGRNRFAACEMVGVKPRFEEWEGGDPIAYVISTNLHRRHLNESQRGMVAVEVKRLYEADARERQRQGGRTKVRADLPEAPRPRDHAAAQLNVSPRLVQNAEKVVTGGAEKIVQAVNTGKVSVDDAARIVALPKSEQVALLRRVESGEAKTLARAKVEAEKSAVVAELNSKPTRLPSGRHDVIVIDPPWRYDARAEDETHRGKVDYPDMTVEEICALPVADLAEPNCVLWLWTTNAFMRHAYTCLDAWGFTDKTILTWDKERLGVGNWLRNVTEHCILAVRGKPVVTLTNQSTILRAPRREHSRKPDEFFELVEKLCHGSKVELFAREPRKGWTSWGGEKNKFAVA